MRLIHTAPIRIRHLVVGLLAVLLLAACGGSDEDAIFFELDTAAETVRAAMVEPSDLPGLGWEVTARDDFGGEGGSSDELRATEPGCAEMNVLADAMGINNLFTDEISAQELVTRGQVELQRTSVGVLVAPSVEVDIQIARTAEETARNWATIQPMLATDAARKCMAAVFTTAAQARVTVNGGQIRFTPITAPAFTPRGGVGHALLLTVSVEAPPLLIEAVMHMYWWSYGNAQVGAFITALKHEMTDAFVSQILAAVDAKIVAAEANQ